MADRRSSNQRAEQRAEGPAGDARLSRLSGVISEARLERAQKSGESAQKLSGMAEGGFMKVILSA